jgi:exodeoxyribonuclease VII large subunit
VDDLAEGLAGGIRRAYMEKNRAAQFAIRRLLAATPTETLARLRTRTEGLGEALSRSVLHRKRLTRERFAALAHRLEAGSPLAVLGRGYAVCRRLPDLKVLREASAASVGDGVRVDLGTGHLVCGVQEVNPKEGILEERT